jgi:hypothetical protein
MPTGGGHPKYMHRHMPTYENRVINQVTCLTTAMTRP